MLDRAWGAGDWVAILIAGLGLAIPGFGVGYFGTRSLEREKARRKAAEAAAEEVRS